MTFIFFVGLTLTFIGGILIGMRFGWIMAHEQSPILTAATAPKKEDSK